MVKAELVPPKDASSYSTGVVELEVVVGGKTLKTVFVYATGDNASGGAMVYDVSSPFVAVVALSLDVTDEDIGEESTLLTLEADELNALENVVCRDCDVVSSLLKASTKVAESEVDDDREDNRK